MALLIAWMILEVREEDTDRIGEIRQPGGDDTSVVCRDEVF